MAAKAIVMEQLKQILRLRQQGFSISSIARHTGASRPTIIKYLARIDKVIDNNDAAALNDKTLSEIVYNDDIPEAKRKRYSELL